MTDSIERIAADCAWESHRLRNSGSELADYEAWERIATRLRALSPAGGEEWAEKARKMIVELRDYVVNERDSQVLPRKRAGYQRELDEVDALLAASPQQEAATATSGECRCHEGNGALHCTIHTQADFDAQQPTTANESKTNGQTLAGAGGVDAISLAYELEGVIIDVEQGNGFDDICLNTIKRVRDALFAATSAGTTGDDSEDAAALRTLRNLLNLYSWREVHTADGVRYAMNIRATAEYRIQIDAARRAREVGNAPEEDPSS